MKRTATRFGIRHAAGVPVPAKLKTRELCWGGDGQLYIGLGDDGNGNATSVEVIGGNAGVAWDDIDDKPETATRWPTWGEVTDKPTLGTMAAVDDAPNSLDIYARQGGSWVIIPSAPTIATLTFGNGLSGSAYNGSVARTVSLGTPSTLTPSTTNSATSTSHTHNVTGFLPLTGGTLTGVLDTSSVIAVAGKQSLDSSGWAAQGAWVGWNFPTGYGNGLFVNSMGGGSGGWSWFDRTSSGTYTLLATLAQSGSSLNSWLESRAGIFAVGGLKLPGTTAQYVRGDGSLATLPSGGGGANHTAGNGLSGSVYDGSVARTWDLGTPSTLTPSTSNGTTSTSHTHQITGFLPLTGGTLTGTLTGTTIQGSTIRETSDLRLKRDIAELRDGLDIIRALVPVRYAREAGGAREIGLIAQDLEHVLPEVVTTDDDGYLAVSYARIVAPLIAAVQAIDKRISALEARL